MKLGKFWSLGALPNEKVLYGVLQLTVNLNYSCKRDHKVPCRDSNSKYPDTHIFSNLLNMNSSDEQVLNGHGGI